MSRLNVAAAVGLAAALLTLGSGTSLVMSTVAQHTTATSAPATSSTTTSDTKPAAPAPQATPFGQQVKTQAVAACKTSVRSGGTRHGIGACVSAWVTGHNPGHTRQGAP